MEIEPCKKHHYIQGSNDWRCQDYLQLLTEDIHKRFGNAIKRLQNK